MLHFNPQTGLYPDEITVVRENVRQDWIDAFKKDGLPPLNTEPETPAGQLIDSQTAAIADKDAEVLYLANQFNPETAEGIWQDALAKIYFLKRKNAQPSEAVCTCTGLTGTVIPAGALIQSPQGDGIQWSCAEDTTIPLSGSISVRFVCLTTGPIMASADTLTQIVTVVPGWDSVTNPTAAIVGRDEETRIELEKRRYASVAANAHGSVAALYGAIANIEDVIDVVVLENATNETVVQWGVSIPGHSVSISVVGGDDAGIAQAIYEKKDAGCGTAGNTTVTYQDDALPGAPLYSYQIERPATLAFGVKITIRATAATPNNIESLIKTAVLNDFNGLGAQGNARVGMAQTVYASRFYCPVIASGAQDLISIEISAGEGAGSGAVWADSVTINANQAPALDENDILVIIQEQSHA